MLFKDVRGASQGCGIPQSGAQRAMARVAIIAAIAAAGLALLAGLAFRRWLAAAAANVCVLGGILATPVLALIAWVGILLPTSFPLHRAAPGLVVGALAWLALAIIGAHAFGVRRPPRAG